MMRTDQVEYYQEQFKTYVKQQTEDRFESENARGYAGSLQQVLQDIQKSTVKALKKIDKIEADNRLTEQGKQRPIHIEQIKATKSIALMNPEAKIKNQIRDIEGQLVENRAKQDDIAAQLRINEIRRFLIGLGVPKAIGPYLQASEDLDYETIEAVELAPACMKAAIIHDQSIIERARTERLRGLFPSKFLLIDDLKMYIKIVQNAIQFAADVIMKRSGMAMPVELKKKLHDDEPIESTTDKRLRQSELDKLPVYDAALFQLGGGQVLSG